jgi:hypothetical protein
MAGRNRQDRGHNNQDFCHGSAATALCRATFHNCAQLCCGYKQAWIAAHRREVSLILHASIPAGDTGQVAQVLAKIWHAEYFQFVFPGSFVMLAGNARATMIEVCRRADEQMPEKVDVGLRRSPTPSTCNQIHLNLATPPSIEQILALAMREGWIARVRDRAVLNLAEVWIENRFLIELVPQKEAARDAVFTAMPGIGVKQSSISQSRRRNSAMRRRG